MGQAEPGARNPPSIPFIGRVLGQGQPGAVVQRKTRLAGSEQATQRTRERASEVIYSGADSSRKQTGGDEPVEFQELVERRRSVRRYSAESVDSVVLDRILHMISRAPSAGNLQAYRIVVVRSAQRRRALAAAAEGQEFLGQAPVDLVFFADPDRSAMRYGKRGASLYAVQDATIAATFAALAATNEGLASVWVGAFDESAVRAACGESQLRPVAILALGHGAETPADSTRRALSETVREV